MTKHGLGWRHTMAVLAVSVAAAGVNQAVHAQDDPAPGREPFERGRELYLTGCASCHDADGTGARDDHGDPRGPSLLKSGEASAYYYLSTGRMPLADSEEQPRRKRPAYRADDIDALVEYVASLGAGPPLPDVELEDADLAEGGELFRANCAACHSAAGAGGALSYGRAAPNLHEVEPLQVAAAVRAGPGQMPVFGSQTLDNEQVDSIVKYVEFLKTPDDRGGVPLGRIGPIPEGLVAWMVGTGALVLAVMWIGTWSPVNRRRRGHP